MKRTHLTTLAAAFGTLALTLALAACAPSKALRAKVPTATET